MRQKFVAGFLIPLTVLFCTQNNANSLEPAATRQAQNLDFIYYGDAQAESKENESARMSIAMLPMSQNYLEKTLPSNYYLKSFTTTLIDPQTVPPASTKQNPKSHHGLTLKFVVITFAIIAGATIIIAVLGGRK